MKNEIKYFSTIIEQSKNEEKVNIQMEVKVVHKVKENIEEDIEYIETLIKIASQLPIGELKIQEKEIEVISHILSDYKRLQEEFKQVDHECSRLEKKEVELEKEIKELKQQIKEEYLQKYEDYLESE